MADPRMVSESDALPDDLLERFWEKGLVLFGQRVQQEYGLATPVFIDLRHKLYDDLAVLAALGQALHERLISIVAAEPDARSKPQQVIGIPDTATPLALATALGSRSSSSPVTYGQMRKKPAAYPGGRSGLSAYMGSIHEAREITLIDDVMASGRSKLWAIEELKKDGLAVKRVLVVVDREQGGEKGLEEIGCPVYSLYRISGVIDYFASRGKLDADTARAALEHIRSKRFG